MKCIIVLGRITHFQFNATPQAYPLMQSTHAQCIFCATDRS